MVYLIKKYFLTLTIIIVFALACVTSIFQLLPANAAGFYIFPDHHKKFPDRRNYYPHSSHNKTIIIKVPVHKPSREPDAPSLLGAVAKENGIELNWKPAVGNNYGYYIMRSDNFGANYGILEFVGPGAASYFDSNVAIGTTYYYYIQNVYCDGRTGACSNQAVARAIGRIIPKVVMVPRIINEGEEIIVEDSAGVGIEIPSGVSAKYSKKSVSLTWNFSNMAEGYEIYRAVGKPVDFKKIGEIKGANSFEDKKINASTRYFYYLIAFSETGRSGSSNIVAAGAKAM